ncbi:hypothetical protein SELMODRAFT_451567 [Selaginella moellendorffii]|uniref:ATP-dependent DNA helicase n=1 Tax=Selaginella moellendorffii TaxID=88036 RepID=D8RVZ3_SELML|nr:ATP-dependent DNA helicase PIF1 [Selaginella moellendorffii]EFJ23459.1 hypothetical protein SELMODRAFT_451567 [Selaginella moellendorffii]|eukprot:XP_002975258.1 ATP-dependent DNA helicase PIF1 [Selaginella moellendorffii]
MDVIMLKDDQSRVLTEQQRNRALRQRDLALARRQARMSGSTLVPTPSQQEVIDITSSPIRESSKSKPEVIVLGESDDEVIHSTVRAQPSIPAPPLVRKEDTLVRNLESEGWRETRKRPSPEKESFGPCKAVKMGTADEGTSSGNKNGNFETKEATPSPEQLRVLEAVCNRQSVFVTGSAGTGKSYILERAIQVLRTVYHPSAVYVTASTGIAACAIGGTTFHAFAGVGIGLSKKEQLVDMVMRSKEKKQRWLNAAALVIDEISMIDAELFDKVDFVGRAVRRSKERFGGLQLIVTGDFFQLPPVQKPGETKSFVFSAKCWKECFDLQMELTQVFRQSDREFVGMLNEIRRGECSFATETRLKSCTSISTAPGIEPTRLYPRRADVDRENEQKLRSLNPSSKSVTFSAKDSGRTQMLNGSRAEAEITLAIGAQVMLIKNLGTEQGLVNGARGIVVGFTAPEKSELRISPGGGLPVVRFNHSGSSEWIIRPEAWSVMEGEVEVAKRLQLPLILAWALSVHKCQGMTLDCVETDLSRTFEYGMVYVALSRVRSLHGLRLLGFDPLKIRVHPEVVTFYDQLKGR